MSTRRRSHKKTLPKSRKEIRKEHRKNKKAKRHEYYTNRKKPGQFVLLKDDSKNTSAQLSLPSKTKENKNIEENERQFSVEKIREKEKKEEIKLQKEMNKQRKKQLFEANMDEDRTIKRLEKQLKLNKRKSKSVPSSFAADGLDYLLEVCDSENMNQAVLTEQHLTEVNDAFEEDFALMANDDHADSSDNDNLLIEENISDDEASVEISCTDDSDEPNFKRKKIKPERFELSGYLNEDHGGKDEYDDDFSNREDDDTPKSIMKEDYDGTWEDIYGRLRTADGSVVKENNEKYIPPAARMKEKEVSNDLKKCEKNERLRKQLKGLLNRLAESNMHNITTQIEELYMNNSRNDMNSTITKLVMEAISSNILTPERLLMEHVLLIVILHANVGTEVGSHFLLSTVKIFDQLLMVKGMESKQLDNIVTILAQLYNFKVFDCKLMYEIIYRLVEGFTEKDIECILHILRNVGFSLRKDNPLELKQLILDLQKKAVSVPDNVKNSSRVKFMLDILLAIKNNNVSKIPNYDTTYSEHLKKVMKGFIRKGNYITQLNIALEDLLKVEENGKWWVVGSAWSGNDGNNKLQPVNEKPLNFSQKLYDLAVKQRMNTDTRKSIFYVIMSAEDYIDAFEKLLRLSLKNQQDRDIIHVILHCCLREKKFNLYYAALAQKFCEYDRKYQMTIKYSIWDKLKALQNHSTNQISNLAKLLTYLFTEKGLSLSTLKIVQFSELDKITLRFIRQILLGILLHGDLEICKEVFYKVCRSDKLKMFRESLKLFIYHFLLRNLNSQGISEEKKELLQQRVKIVEKMLTGKNVK